MVSRPAEKMGVASPIVPTSVLSVRIVFPSLTTYSMNSGVLSQT